MGLEDSFKKAFPSVKADIHLMDFLRGSAISAAGAILLGIANYFIRRNFALELSAKDYGFLYAVLALVAICMALAEFGAWRAGVILIARHLANGKSRQAELAFGSVSAFNLLSSAALALVLAVFSAPLVREFFKYPEGHLVFLLFIPYFLLMTFSCSLKFCMNAMKLFSSFNLVVIVQALAVLLGSMLLVKRFGLAAAPFIFFFATALEAWLAWLLLKRASGPRLIPVALFRSARTRSRLLGLGAWVAVSNICLTCMFNVSILCLTWMGCLEDVALYNIAIPVMQIVYGVVIILPLVLTPIAAEMWAKGRSDALWRNCKLMSLALLASLPFFLLAGWLFAPWIITLLFSAKFVGASASVTILWAGMLFNVIAQLNMNAINAGGEAKTAAICAIAGVFVNLVLNVCLIPLFGIDGAAAATALTYIFLAAYSVWSLRLLVARKAQAACEA